MECGGKGQIVDKHPKSAANGKSGGYMREKGGYMRPEFGRQSKRTITRREAGVCKGTSYMDK
jgi:hypothetical protein